MEETTVTRFYFELPADEYGNTYMKPAVIEMHVEDGRLRPVAPAHHASKWAPGWPLHGAIRFAETEGPARMLSRAEYDALIASLPANTGTQDG